jgi:hypothetical protein
MRAKRAWQLRDVHLPVDLDPGRCLDAADYLARHADRYGIGARIELRRACRDRAYDRHLVVCHAERDRAKALWVMELVLLPAVDRQTRVTLRMVAARRFGRRAGAAKAADTYRRLYADALRLASAPRDRRQGNVIPLRPYAELAPVA